MNYCVCGVQFRPVRGLTANMHRPGDLSVCANCGAPLVYELEEEAGKTGLVARVLTREQLDALPQYLRRQLEVAQRAQLRAVGLPDDHVGKR